MSTQPQFDVIIVGGSYAGLSAAMALGRSLRTVLIIDSGLPCNRQTPHSHNFLTQDGKTPQEIASVVREQLSVYKTIQFHDGLAASGRKEGSNFEITTQEGAVFSAKKLIFATGIQDQLPDIKGFAACWGISIIHCPYCHGYEYRDQATGIMLNGEMAAHLAPLIHNLSKKLSILTSGKADFTTDQLNTFKKHQINIIEKQVTEVVHTDGQLQEVMFEDGETMPFDAIYARVPFTQHCTIPIDLGCQLTEQDYIEVDPFQKTSVDGILACGDNTTMMRSVANAVYSGNIAGVVANKELAVEEF